MSCCFIKKDRDNASALANVNDIHNLQLMDIRAWRYKCIDLQLCLQRFQVLKSFQQHP